MTMLELLCDKCDNPTIKMVWDFYELPDPEGVTIEPIFDSMRLGCRLHVPISRLYRIDGTVEYIERQKVAALKTGGG